MFLFVFSKQWNCQLLPFLNKVTKRTLILILTDKITGSPLARVSHGVKSTMRVAGYTQSKLFLNPCLPAREIHNILQIIYYYLWLVWG